MLALLLQHVPSHVTAYMQTADVTTFPSRTNRLIYSLLNLIKTKMKLASSLYWRQPRPTLQDAASASGAS